MRKASTIVKIVCYTSRSFQINNRRVYCDDRCLKLTYDCLQHRRISGIPTNEKTPKCRKFTEFLEGYQITALDRTTMQSQIKRRFSVPFSHKYFCHPYYHMTTGSQQYLAEISTLFGNTIVSLARSCWFCCSKNVCQVWHSTTPNKGNRYRKLSYIRKRACSTLSTCWKTRKHSNVRPHLVYSKVH